MDPDSQKTEITARAVPLTLMGTVLVKSRASCHIR
jgi:hypothetical protein